VEDDHGLERSPDPGNILGGERRGASAGRRVLARPAEESPGLGRDLLLAERGAVGAVGPVLAGGEPAGSQGLAAFPAAGEVGEQTVGVEEPGLEVGRGELSVAPVPKTAEDGEEKAVEDLLLGPGRGEFLDELGEVGQQEGRRRLGLDLEERLEEVAAGDRDQVAALLLVVEDPDDGQGLEAAAEAVAELPGALGHAADDALVPAEEDGDLVLVADVGRPQDDGFRLVGGHGLDHLH